MAAPRTPQKLWVIALAGTAVAAGAVLMLFREPPALRPPAEKPPAKRTVTLVNDKDHVVTEESILLDPTALFLPTRWNATQREIPRREAGGMFQGYDTPRHSFAENELKLGLPAPIAVPTGAAEAVMVETSVSALVGLGRTDQAVPIPPLRGGFVEIVAAASGRSVLAQAILERPPVSDQWQPVEFMAAVDASGLIGPLVVTTRSGLEEVDSFFFKLFDSDTSIRFASRARFLSNFHRAVEISEKCSNLLLTVRNQGCKFPRSFRFLALP